MDIKTSDFKVIGLTSMPINNIYEENDEISPVISFEGEGEHALSYKVVDYFGITVKSDTVNVSGTGSYKITFDETPKRGYYVVYTEIDGVSTCREDLFTVVISSDERKYYDSFISLDVASFHVDPTHVEDYARMAHLAGITHVRERNCEPARNGSADEYDFSGFDRVVNAYSKYGIRVLSLNHGIPSSMHSSKYRIIDDIRKKYNYHKALASRYQDKVDYEIWNEPELDHMTLGPKIADNMAALFKAEAIALMDSGADCLSVMPGMAAAPSEYLAQLMQNDIAKFVDTYSYHGHRICWGEEANDMRDMIPPASWGRHAVNYSKLGARNLRFYNTEAGLATEMLDGKDYIEVERQKAQARYLPSSIIQGAALGEHRHTYFLFPAYREGNLQWGMMTYSRIPYASYSALSTLTHVLGEAKYINAIPKLQEGVRGEVFADGEYRVAGFWSEKDVEITVSTDAEVGVLVNIMGTEQEIRSENGVFKLSVSPDIVYLKIKGNFIGAEKKKYPDKRITRHSLTRAERVVIELIFPDEISERAKYNGYRLSEDKKTTVIVRATNFNNEPITGYICGRAYGGWQLDESRREITLGAMDQQDLVFTISAGGEIVREIKTPLVFVGEFDGEKSSRAVTQIISDTEGEVHSRPIIGAMKAENWDDNVQIGSELTIKNVDEETLEVACSFTHENKWLYPRMYLEDGDTFEGTCGMLFDLYVDDIERMPVVRNWAHEKNGCAYYLEQELIKLKPGWNRIKIPWSALQISEFSPCDDNFTLDDYDICRISIGVNPHTKDIRYMLRNISVYSSPQDKVFSRINIHKPVVDENRERVTVDAYVLVYETGMLEETLVLRVDGEEMPFTYNDGRVHAELNLPQGKHELAVQFEDECGYLVDGISLLTL